jgi:hypothetical protein
MKEYIDLLSPTFIWIHNHFEVFTYWSLWTQMQSLKTKALQILLFKFPSMNHHSVWWVSIRLQLDILQTSLFQHNWISSALIGMAIGQSTT